MLPDPTLSFGPYRLDPGAARLWRGKQLVKVRGKTFAVLRFLANRPGQLVTKDELFRAVWPGTVVSEATLTACIKELRQALRDDARTPRYIETAHGQGFRFIAAVTVASVPRSMFEVPSSPPPASDSTKKIPASFQLGTWNLKPETLLVGRESELTQLHGWLAKALNGERQIVFVSGEAGIGKTAVVEAFLQHVASTPVWVGRGQCIEHYGAGEGYMPVLEALGRLCRESEGRRFVELLHQHAPSWLVQMPALLSTADLEALQRKVAGVTRERMLRELAEAVEALTTERPLILRLEDLHWSDPSTLELLSVLGRRQEAARLLVLGTYRPVEMLANGHPLRAVRQELQLHKQCEEQRLTFLTEEHVAEYLAGRFEGGTRHVLPFQKLARMVHQRTEGNPLFMVNMVDYLAAQGGLGASGESAQVGIPGDLRQMIEEQLHRVSAAERRVLEVASVAGVKFSAAAVAVGLGIAVEEVEEQCEGLVHREQFLQAREPAEWPDGTVATRYQFLHALYQDVLYERISAARRSQLHRVIGERTEAAYDDRASEVATELAVHFERGRDYRRAIQYLHQAGENAVRRSAHQEAITLLTKGLELLNTLPDIPARTQQELALQVTLGPPLQTTKGFAAPEVGQVYARARELCQQVGETPQLFPALRGLWGFYMVGAEFQSGRELGEQLRNLAQRIQDPVLLLEAHLAMGTPLFHLGELIPAREHLERGIALYNLQQHRSLAFLYGTGPGVHCLSYAAHALWVLGYPAQALKRSQEALALAHELSYPFMLALSLDYAATVHQFRRERQTAQEQAAAAITLCAEQQFAYYLAWGTVLQGWALAEQEQGEEGVAQIRQGVAAFRATGAGLRQPYYLALLAEACGKGGRAEEGLSALSEALMLVNKTGERWCEAELYRLKGELLLAQEGSRLQAVGLREKTQEAEECFLGAIEIAQKQQAKSLELRATMSLTRLWQQQGKQQEAHTMLSEVYTWFTEGFDTKDLQEAKALLEELT